MTRDNPPFHSKALAETIDETQQIPEKDLISLLDDVADRFPHHDAILSLHQEDHLDLGGTGSPAKPTRWTYSQLRKGSIRLAARLAAEGMRHGSRIVAVFFNEAEWALLFWASARLGCQFVPLDPRVLDHKKDALHILDKVQPAAVFVSNPTMADRVDEIVGDMEHRPLLKCVASVIDDVETGRGWMTMSKALSDMTDGVSPAGTVGINDIVLILFTSGTTSRPKGCPHSAITIGSPAFMVMDVFGLDPGHSLCQHLPSFHIFNIFLSIGFWLSGATVVLPSASFDPASDFRAFATSPKMHVPCVPSMIQALTTYASSTDKMAFSAPFSILLGGAPLTPDILELSRSLGTKQIVVGYGTTEGVGTAMNVMDINSLDVVDEEVCIGTVKSGARLRFCQPGSRVPILRGEIGEVHQGGLPVFSGYLDGSPEELATCYQEEGVNWWASGDRGYLDEKGRLFLLGRYKDLIIRGGENISPVKIENCLGKMTGVHVSKNPNMAVCVVALGLKGIQSAYVVGVPDTVAGEVPVAVITRDSQTRVATSDLQAAVLADLGRSFSPTMILDLHNDLGKEQYPTTTSGKIQKSSLRQWVTDYLEQRCRIEQSSNDVLTELLECWSAVTGLSREAIDPDASIKTFADSMMIIQFFNMASRKLPRHANSTLTISDTVRQQAEMLQPKKPEPTEVIVGSKCHEHEAEPLDQLRAEETTTARLAPLGFGWGDVEELIPMTDYFSYFARIPVRPYHWNPRIALVVDPSISQAELKQALYQWLERHPLFRATTVTYDDDLDLYVVMRPTSGWLELQVTDGSTVDDVAALKTYRLNDASWDWLSRTGPLLKTTLVPLRNPPGATGIILHVHHIMFDYHNIHRALEDLRDLISKPTNNSNAPLQPFHHYRSFAHSYRTYRSSSTAQEDVNFHVDRLRGISKDSAAVWPPLCQDSDSLPPDPSKRRAFNVISRSARLSEIGHVQAQAGVSAAMIGKCACTLVNLRHTRASEAIFTTTHSGRLWPTASSSHGHKTTAQIHPLEIDGPTLVWRVERVAAPAPHETTIQFLRRVSQSQDDMVTHTHAPLGKILHGLSHPPEPDSGLEGPEGEEKATNTADATLINRILFHQLFNWVLEKINDGSVSSTADSPLRVVDMLSQADLSFVWAPSLRPDNVCVLDIRYRHGQFEAGEVEPFAEEFLEVMRWLAEPGNLHKPVLESGSSGGHVAAVVDGVGSGGVANGVATADAPAPASAFAPVAGAVVDGVGNGVTKGTAVADDVGNGAVGDSAGDSEVKDEEDADNEGRRKRRKLCA